MMNSEKDISELVNELNQKQQKIAQELLSGNQQMRTLAKRVWRVQEDERKHIARELHDGVGQLLTALINQLQQMHKEGQPDPKELHEALNLAKQALSDTREISRLMRPRILDDLGLIPALQWLTRVMGEKNSIEIELHEQLSVGLDDETQTLVFRVVQEAITNAIKHAQATHIDITVIATERMLVIKIKDNGVGMTKELSESVDGFGLSAMRDRVAAFGGQLMVESKPNEGCEIKVIITGAIGNGDNSV